MCTDQLMMQVLLDGLKGQLTIMHGGILKHLTTPLFFEIHNMMLAVVLCQNGNSNIKIYF